MESRHKFISLAQLAKVYSIYSALNSFLSHKDISAHSAEPLKCAAFPFHSHSSRRLILLVAAAARECVML